jgi:LemA protein
MNSRPRWLVPVLAVVAVIVVLIVPLVGSYNGLVDKETAVDQSFADLDAVLQRRADLIPNLSAAVEAALDQEQEVFGELARARANYAGATSEEDRLEASGQLEAGLGRLLVIVENYPQLQSNQQISDLMVQLEGTENRVAQGRRDYNGVVTDYNRSIRRFPRSIFAGLFGFEKRVLFEAEPADREAPQVDLGNDDEE